MDEKFFVDNAGTFLGVFVGGAVPPQGAIEVSTQPSDGRARWKNGAWVMQDDPKTRIAELETSITPRRMREAVLTEEGKTWLASVESAIALERAKL